MSAAYVIWLAPAASVTSSDGFICLDLDGLWVELQYRKETESAHPKPTDTHTHEGPGVGKKKREAD
jgi:hypothetical protein